MLRGRRRRFRNKELPLRLGRNRRRLNPRGREKITRDALPWMFDGWIDFFAVEQLLMLCGWKLGMRNGLYIAYRSSDGKRIARVNRKEALALAYILTPVEGQTVQPDDYHMPALPLSALTEPNRDAETMFAIERRSGKATSNRD